MARTAGGAPGHAADDAAYSLDEIDAGWNEAPASMVAPANRPRQVSESPTTSPWSVFAKLDAKTTATHGAALVVPKAPALPTFPSRPRRNAARFAALGAVACALAGAGGYFTTHSRALVPSPASARTPLAASPDSTAASPAVTAPEPSEVTAITAPAPLAVPAVEPPAEPSASLVTVLINVIPKRAVIFRGGERLGSGLVAINVERTAKERLTAVADGYEKSRFTVDGTRDTITIYLSRVPQAVAPAAPASEPTVDAPSPAPPPAPLADGPSSTVAPE